MKEIFIKLLNEGTDVYRPVPAKELGVNMYEVGGIDFYDADDEIWEFIPGDFVLVEKRILTNKMVLVAIKKT